MAHPVTIIYGDGIGPEVVSAAREVVDAAGVKIEWHAQLLGLSAIAQKNDPVPHETIESIRVDKVAIKGPTTTPVGAGHKSANVTLRKVLDLYACIRPVKSIPGIGGRHDNVDLVIIRENTEGLYGGQEIEVYPGCVISFRTMTQRALSRISELAFLYAQQNNRSKVTLGHKANILKMGDGLFLRVAENVHNDFPKIQFEQVIVDALCMRLVMDPGAFQVILLENMFGDLLSDLCAGLVGGLGVACGANLGDEIAVFEAAHGSAPDIAGKDLANPTALIQSAILMLKHLGEVEAAMRIERALLLVLKEKPLRTRDLGGTAGTHQFVRSILRQL